MMITLGGIGIDDSCDPGTRDLLAEAGLRLGPQANAIDQEHQGKITLALHQATSDASQDPTLEGYRPTFYQGIVQAYQAPLGRPSATLLWDQRTRILVHEAEARIEGFVSEEDVVPGSAATTLEIALALALRGFGRFHLHAAAVVHPRGESLLFVGGSGSGKTTTTLTLLEAGWAFLSDDALIVCAAPEGIRISAFPRHFHVGPRTASAFARLGKLMRAAPGYGDKRALDPHLAFPGQARPVCGAPKVVLYPHIDPAEKTTLLPLSKAEGLGHLIAASAGLVIDVATQKAAHLALLGELANEASHFDLRLGEDVLQNPKRFVETLTAL